MSHEPSKWLLSSESSGSFPKPLLHVLMRKGTLFGTEPCLALVQPEAGSVILIAEIYHSKSEDEKAGQTGSMVV